MPPNFFEPGEYLLGDSAYGVCFPFIVTPYKRPAAQLPANARFNRLLSRARIAIEHCIGMVKARFPFLSLHGVHLGEDGAAERLCKTQRVCFMLHNISILQNEDPFDENLDSESDSDSESDVDDSEPSLLFNAEDHFTSDELRLIIHHDIAGI